MAQRHTHNSSRSGSPRLDSSRSRPSRSTDSSQAFGTENQWAESRPKYSRSSHTHLVKLIEQDAPLQGRTQLVLMYGPFQAEMPATSGQGVATWLKYCLKQHGIPSLLRFDDRRCAQVFRRDQFQPWLESLMQA